MDEVKTSRQQEMKGGMNIMSKIVFALKCIKFSGFSIGVAPFGVNFIVDSSSEVN